MIRFERLCERKIDDIDNIDMERMSKVGYR